MSMFDGDKTEQPTGKRLDEAFKHGQFARSAELQTAVVLLAAFTALTYFSHEMWIQMARAMTGIFQRLHTIPIKNDLMQEYFAVASATMIRATGPVIGATMAAGLLAGAIQNRFRTTPDVLELNWDRLDVVGGLKRMFSARAVAPSLLAMVRLAIITALSYSEIKSVASDPIFFTSVDVARIAQFLAVSAGRITLRVLCAMTVLAAADYGYQLWSTKKDLMMTKEEVKDESKSSEGNPEIKARQRRVRSRMSFRKTLLDVPKADIVITNPTHLAIALRYDRLTMKAPKVVAKGSRLNALRIREIAKQHQVPILENKPLARLLFKYAKVDGEIPAELYVAVAEVLAWVYRTNRFRYYAERNLSGAARGVTPAPANLASPSRTAT